MTQELQKKIENDITGTFEKDLEKKALESIQKLKAKGKMKDEEINNLYSTNFKKLLAVNVSRSEILVQKISDLNSLTNKLIAKYLSEKKTAKEQVPTYRKAIYMAMGVNVDISKNTTAKNILKGVVDELCSIPEVLVELLKRPIEFVKGIADAFIKNFKQTINSIKEQYTNVFKGVETPDKAYNTGRSAALIILTFLPGASAKLLGKVGKIGRSAITKTKNVATRVVKGETKEMVKQSVATTRSALETTGKKVVEKTKKTLVENPKKILENKALREQNTTARQSLKKLNKQMDELKRQQTPDAAAMQKLKKEIDKTNREINKRNAKLGLDNKKIGQQKRLKNDVDRRNNEINDLKRQLTTEKDIKIKNKLEKDIKKKQEQIKTNKQKLKKIDVRLHSTPRNVVRQKLLPSLTKEGVVVDKLKALLISPKRLPTVKNLLQLRQGYKSIKKQKQTISSLDAQLSKVGKNGKTALENAKKYPTTAKNKNILGAEKQKIDIQKDLDKMAGMQLTQLKNTAARSLLEFGIFGSLTQVALTEKLTYELSEYLLEENDELREENTSQVGLETGSTDVEGVDLPILNTLADEELPTAKIKIIGKASKTGSLSFNQNIALKRAENARDALLEKYPGLDVNNISIETVVQDVDNNDPLEDRQGVDMQVNVDNLTYVGGYTSNA